MGNDVKILSSIQPGGVGQHDTRRFLSYQGQSGAFVPDTVQQPTVSWENFKSYVRFGTEQSKPSPQYALAIGQFEGLMRQKLNKPEFALDTFQKEAMQKLTEGLSLMVSAPTSSGKTLVGEFAIESVLNPLFWQSPHIPPQRNRVFYTTPRKALSNEKFRDFVKAYGAENVGLMTGDITIKPDAPVILMTTEVLRNMLYEQPEKLEQVAKVVFDECHFVNDRDRGPVWEECMIHMPAEVQQVHLSATVGNASEYVDWMNTLSVQKTALVYEDKRPVKLNYLVYNPVSQMLHPVFNGSGKPSSAFFEAFENPDRFHHPDDILEAVAQYKKRSQVDLLPAVTTAFSKKLCNQYFEEIVSDEDGFKVPEPNGTEEKERRLRMRELVREQSEVDPFLTQLNPDLIEGLYRGYGVHHAGMTYAERALVEKALKAGLLKAVWGTDTIGAGINVPERTAIISQLTKFDGEDFDLIGASDFHQIVGRAGRRGIYEPGYVILVPPRGADRDMAYYVLDLIKAKPEKIESKFRATPTMALNLLKTYSVQDAKKVMSKSFAAFQDGASQHFEKQFDKTLAFLKDAGLVTVAHSNKVQNIQLTPVGKDLSLVPDPTFVSMLSLFQIMEKDASAVKKLKDWQLVELLSATLNEKGDNPNLSKNHSIAFQQTTQQFLQHREQLNAKAQASGIGNQSPINFTFSPFLTMWMESGDWPETRKAIERNNLYIGDFMNIVRRTANLIDKCMQMDLISDDLKDKLGKAREKLLQPPVKESIFP